MINVELETCGLLVDQIADVAEVSLNEIYALPHVFAGAANFFESIVWMEDEFRLCLAIDRICQNRPKDPTGPITSLPAFVHNTAASAPASPAGKGQILMFTAAKTAVQDWVLAVSLTQVMEVLEPLPMTTVPGAPDYVLGFVNWRRNPVPVIDLNARLGLGSPAKHLTFTKADSRLLIARAASSAQLCGFLINPNPKAQALPIPHEQLREDLPIAKVWTRGMFELENEMLVVPDLDRLIA
jgi:purine-binding chemotaxis protein CheW